MNVRRGLYKALLMGSVTVFPIFGTMVTHAMNPILLQDLLYSSEDKNVLSASVYACGLLERNDWTFEANSDLHCVCFHDEVLVLYSTSDVSDAFIIPKLHDLGHNRISPEEIQTYKNDNKIIELSDADANYFRKAFYEKKHGSSVNSSCLHSEEDCFKTKVGYAYEKQVRSTYDGETRTIHVGPDTTYENFLDKFGGIFNCETMYKG